MSSKEGFVKLIPVPLWQLLSTVIQISLQKEQNIIKYLAMVQFYSDSIFTQEEVVKAIKYAEEEMGFTDTKLLNLFVEFSS